MKYLSVSACLFAFMAGAILFSGCDGIIGPPPPYRIWKTPVLIDAGNQISNATVSCNKIGNVFAVWVHGQNDGLNDHIWASCYMPDKGWGTATQIDNNSEDASAPQVAVDSSGNAIAVWHQYNNGINHIWANRYVPGKGWGTATQIDNNSGGAGGIQVAIDTSGNAIAVWHQSNGVNHIWANRYVPGMGWGIPAQIDNNSGDAYFAHVAFDISGNAITIWQQSNGTNYHIWVNRYISGTGWGNAVQIENNASNATGPQIAVGAEGNAIAVWYQTEGTNVNIWSNHYMKSYGWGAAAQIDNNLGDNLECHLSINTSGNAIAVWAHKIGTNLHIEANRYVPDKGWGKATQIEDNLKNAQFPHVAVDKLGNAIAVWEQSDDANDCIWFNYYYSGSLGWGNARLLSSGAWGSMIYPYIVTDDSGNATAVWIQTNSKMSVALWASRYCLWNEIDYF